MTASNKKQGACFPIDLWVEIKREAEANDTTLSKVIVQAVREMVDRKNKRRAKK
jgi:shikimate kinase